MIKILEELCRIPVAPGMEKEIFDYITENIPKGTEITFDGIGNLTVIKRCGKKKAKKIMLCTGVDAGGFIVNFIEQTALTKLNLWPIIHLNKKEEVEQ